MKIKKGDQVIVLTGRDKNRTGYVQAIYGEKVLVSGINIVAKHLSEKKHGKNGIAHEEMPIHISNIMFFNGEIKSKIGYKFIDGKKVRFMRKNGQEIGGKV